MQRLSRSAFVFLLLASALAAQSAPAPAVAKAGLTVEQALALKSVTNPQLGADFVAFTLVVPRPIADGPGGSYQHLGVIDGLSKLTAEGVAKEKPPVHWLVSGKDTAPAMAVRPGTREVSFLRARKAVMGVSAMTLPTQLYLQSLDGGEARPWDGVAEGVPRFPSITAYRWRPDGRAIAFTSLDQPTQQQAMDKLAGLRPVIVDEDFQHLSLWIAEEGKEPRKVTEGVTVFDHQWSPDGTKIACAVAPKNTVDDSYMFARLKVFDVASGALTKLVDNPGKLGPFAWSPDGTMLAYVTAADRNDPHAGQVWLARVATGETNVWPAFGKEGMVTELRWGRRFACLEQIGTGTIVHPRIAQVTYDLARTLSVVPERAQITGFDIRYVPSFDELLEDLVCTASTHSHPPELFWRSVGRLTDSNPELANAALGEQTIETIRARDGLEIEGILIKPVGYQEGTKYPFVIVVHGGPEAHFSDGWLTSYGNWGQLLAARGYVSWYPNYRSSTGYGTAFCKHDHGDPMGKEFQDHLDAIAHFRKAGLIDDTRVGIGGGSYGGYTAAWAATKHSEHFAAAVSFVPFVDLRTKWLTSDIPYEFYYVHYQEQWPWQQPGLMADRSPLSWVTNCRTPLLVLGGTNDPRVHPSQPFLLYRAVKFATDTPVRYVQYPGEGHGNRTNGYQLDYALRTLQWFDHYLQGDGDRRKKAMPPLDVAYPQ